jgi:hypothetical protein
MYEMRFNIAVNNAQHKINSTTGKPSRPLLWPEAKHTPGKRHNKKDVADNFFIKKLTQLK